MHYKIITCISSNNTSYYKKQKAGIRKTTTAIPSIQNVIEHTHKTLNSTTESKI